MTDTSDQLGGRTALLAPEALTAPQRKLYDYIDSHMVPWAERSGFQAKLPDGRLIGPFNPVLLSPEIGQAFLEMQAVEGRTTSLPPRVREVVILTVGAVWRCDYERYAHAAVAKAAGLPPGAIAALVAGEASDELNEDEATARRFTRALTADHTVDDALFAEARSMFGEKGIVDMIMLAGCYDIISSLLNAFQAPSPSQRADDPPHPDDAPHR